MGRPPKYRPAGSEQDAADDYAPSDAELGIGEETEAPDQSANARIAAAMSDTVIAAAIEEHIRNEVERRANGNPAGPDFLAAMKALGTGHSQGVFWRGIEVVRHGGPPQLRFHGGAAARCAAMGATGSLLTITHSRELAIAQVLLLRAQ